MENKRFRLGVVICIFNNDFSKIFLLKRNKEKRERNKLDWGNPGGRVEWGEKLVESCIREVKEETGIDLDQKQLKLLHIKEITNNQLAPDVHFLQFVYATKIEEDKEISLNDESDEWKWFDLNSLPEKTLDSKEELNKFAIEAKKKFSENDN